MSRDYFDVLGVPRAFHLDAQALDARFRELSKQLHPDRFAKAAPRERLEAVQRSTELNDAYRVLKNEVKRAEYLLKLEGLDLADEKSGAIKAAPELLMEMMELNEQLAEARAARDTTQVQALAAEVKARRAQAMVTIDQGFYAFERGEREALAGIAQALVSLRYHARFLEQVEAYEDEVAAPSGEA